MEYKEVKRILKQFAESVKKQAIGNLRRNKNNRFITGSSSGNLEGSIGYKLNEYPNSLNLEFSMLEYGSYQDEGVRGSKSSYPQSRNSRFSYSGGSKTIAYFPSLDKWMVKKNLDGVRDAQGRFISRKSLKYLIAKSIYEKGLRASNFFTRPFMDNYLKLPEEFIDAFQLDFDDFIDQINLTTVDTIKK